VRQNTFGAGQPLRDLIVSPLHRIIGGGGGQLEHWFQAEAFAPAKALTDLKGVRSMRGKKTITWLHFACDRHEVISANGCLSETLLLGMMVLQSLSPTKRRLLQDMYGAAGEGDNPLNGPPARACLKTSHVRAQIKQGLAQDAQTSKHNITLWDDDLAPDSASRPNFLVQK
jgi:hypothetical protein